MYLSVTFRSILIDKFSVSANFEREPDHTINRSMHHILSRVAPFIRTYTWIESLSENILGVESRDLKYSSFSLSVSGGKNTASCQSLFTVKYLRKRVLSS